MYHENFFNIIFELGHATMAPQILSHARAV
jgi:hypothetical protein